MEVQCAPQRTPLNTSLHSPYAVVHPIKETNSPTSSCITTEAASDKQLFSKLNKILQDHEAPAICNSSVSSLYVYAITGCSATKRKVLEVMISLASENHGHI